MKNKQPLYTALGWLAWKMITRTVKKRIAGGSSKSGGKGKKAIGLLAVAGVVGGAAYAASNAGAGEE